MLLRKKGMVDMQNMLAQFCMNQLGFGPLGEIRMVAGSTGNAYKYFRDKMNEENLHTAFWKAEVATVTQRNDVILVCPDSNDWLGDDGATATTLTWDKQNVHVLGMDPGGKGGYQRARFAHSLTLAGAPMLTVTGAGNHFKNLRFTCGVAQHDHYTLNVSGAGNVFENVDFAAPLVAAQGADADFANVTLASATQNYFKSCTFGTNNDVDRSAANCILSITGTGGGMNIFQDCIFISRSGGGQATAYFINDAHTGTVVGWNAIFLNCQFLHQGTALTVAIAKASNTSRKLYFDSLCSFAGVTDLIADARVAEVWSGAAGAVEAATDFKQLNKAHILVAT